MTEPDERRAVIANYLRGKLGADSSVELENVVQMGTGWSHQNFLFDAVWSDAGGQRRAAYCLRLDPGTSLLRSESDLATQFEVLSALADSAVPVPRVYWYETDTALLGGPFLIMEKVPGVAPSPWSENGRRFYENASTTRLPESFTDALAAIHNLDWRAAGLDFLGVPDDGSDFALREVRKWVELIDEADYERHPVLEDVICWLERNAPSTERLTLVHAAYRTGNILFDGEHVSAVLDWELQVIGDPMYDVAYVLSDLNREGTELLSNLVDRRDFITRYEAATGLKIDLEVCRYYGVLYALRSAAFWISASDLYAQGKSDDLRLARTAWSIPVVLDQAAKGIGY
jgi:aminoglycoside phosphotransferase (APT) family kinase protein